MVTVTIAAVVVRMLKDAGSPCPDAVPAGGDGRPWCYGRVRAQPIAGCPCLVSIGIGSSNLYILSLEYYRGFPFVDVRAVRWRVRA
jgi:hypothetical protein